MTSRVGIVGNGADKFNSLQVSKVKDLITLLLQDAGTVLISGHSPVGGVDIWAEEIALQLGIGLDIKTPKAHSWSGIYGYRGRNLDIAKSSDIVHIIVSQQYPEGYEGGRFKICYHCGSERPPHVKSGGCWTGIKAQALGKTVIWHIIG